MPHYLLYFNQQWVGDHSEEWFAGRAAPAKACVQEMEDAGIHVFSGGLEEKPPIAHADPTSGRTVVTDGPYAETKEWLGGFALIDVPDEETAKHWAARIAEACGWPHEVRKFGGGPSAD